MFAIYKDLDDMDLPYILVEKGGESRRFSPTIEECLVSELGVDDYENYTTKKLYEAETLEELRLLILLES